MSAFLCSDLHTAVVAHAVKALLPNCRKSVATVYRELRSLNSAALVLRYGDEKAQARNVQAALDRGAAYLIARPDPVYKARLLFSLIECFGYQCSEGSNMASHRAAPMLEAAEAAAGAAAQGHRAPSVWTI